MLNNKYKYILLLCFFLISCFFIYTTTAQNNITIPNKEKENTYTKNSKEETKSTTNSYIKDNSIGSLLIEKINLNQKLYEINSIYNNVDKNVTILEESIEPFNDNSIMFIAAHSGNGIKAYFKNLHKLNINDEVTLEYYNIKYTYLVKDIYEIYKDGTIEVTKEDKKQLILTTCSENNNKQLIINCTIKEP